MSANQVDPKTLEFARRASVPKLQDWIHRLVEDAQAKMAKRDRLTAHVQRFPDDPKVAERLSRILEDLQRIGKVLRLANDQLTVKLKQPQQPRQQQGGGRPPRSSAPSSGPSRPISRGYRARP